MTEELMVGTVGWDHADWVGSYYPDDLPEDWRFAYYSNDFRSILVPRDHWPVQEMTAVQDWLEDSSGEFRFVLQPPVSVSTDSRVLSFDDFFRQMDCLLPRTAGWLISFDGKTGNLSDLEFTLDMLAGRGPVCVDLVRIDEDEEVIAGLLSRYHAGQCWYPVRQAKPVDGGSLMVAISDSADAKAQRYCIEVLENWMRRNRGVAGLFFTGNSAPKAASQARVIAEMLGI